MRLSSTNTVNVSWHSKVFENGLKGRVNLGEGGSFGRISLPALQHQCPQFIIGVRWSWMQKVVVVHYFERNFLLAKLRILIERQQHLTRGNNRQKNTNRFVASDYLN